LFRRMSREYVTYSPRLKAGASTLSATAKANLRLIVAPVAQRCSAVFDVNYGIVILRDYDRGRIFTSRTAHINLAPLYAISAEKTQDTPYIPMPEGRGLTALF